MSEDRLSGKNCSFTHVDFFEKSSIDYLYLKSVDLSKPVILAEIAPERYNLIDGHHRMEKARGQGLEKLWAYKLSVNQHLRFLTSREAYEAYITYWNDKFKG